ncbi:MAG: hypothetical protein RLZZ427_54 [Pseudomonadota bacterium]|jgi:DNA repair photolyase
MRKERGRGATENQISHRFGLPAHAADGDWLDLCETVDGPAPKLRTTVTTEHPRTIITRNASPDIPFDRSINAYRGCEHGCIYCYARPSHAFHDLSPGLDFETRLFAKPAAAKLLRAELARPAYRPDPIAMGTNTDPYQPIEGRFRITRGVLEVCLETRHPVTITTKSARVLRDIDLLAQLAQLGLTAVSISVTSLDPKLSGLLEPRASAPAKRLDALARLVEAGIPTHVSVAPVIPAITDHFIEGILEAAAAHGVQTASWIMLRLPHEVAPLFKAWLAAHFPDRAAKVLHTVQAMRHGKDNDPQFFTRMKPDGVWADVFRTRFRVACQRLGLNRVQPTLDCSQFIKPNPDGQLQLL